MKFSIKSLYTACDELKEKYPEMEWYFTGLEREAADGFLNISANLADVVNHYGKSLSEETLADCQCLLDELERQTEEADEENEA